jgi:N-acetylneuraminic acid mutarotase
MNPMEQQLTRPSKTFRLLRSVRIAALLLITSPAVAQTWSAKADPLDCRYDGVAFAIDGQVYYGAGITCAGTHSNLFRKFDPSTNTWSGIASLPGDTRRIALSFAVGGKGYVIGGIPQDGIAVDDVWEYDPVSDSWTQKNDFPGGARGASATMVCNGKAYVCGGLSYMVFYQDMWEYTPGTDSWTQKANFPGGIITQASGFALGTDCYLVFGKDNDLGIFNDLWKYNTLTNTWTQMADHPGPGRTNGTAFALNGLGYAGYGADGITRFGDFYAYDPLTNDWTAVSSIPGAPSYYDASVATESAGYCVMRGTSETLQETWEFSLGTAGITASRDASHVPFTTRSTANGLLIRFTDLSGDAVFHLFNAGGQLIAAHMVRAGDELGIDASAGLFFATITEQGGRSFSARVMVDR